MNSYSCLGIRLDADTPIFIINYYHHVIDRRPNLHHLFMLPVPEAPLLLYGNFNTHSPFWSPLEISTSPWAHTLEAWLETYNLMSLVPEGAITHQGTRKVSLIDHIFVNPDFLAIPTFPASCSVSFERSISSDHAALYVTLPLFTPLSLPPPQLSWIIEDQMEQEWKHAFGTFPCPLISDIPSLIRAGNDLIALTHATCNKFFARKCSHGNKGLAWWNDACRIAATEVS